ncbi:hypothetical protein [Phenylobacterium sp.]|uniref:DUF6946 family protein n=1 Tax=Phenylobacterium sp. TaxID=1871053 RepID=UPI0035B138BB
MTGYSARTVAHAWEASDGLPPDVAACLEQHFGRVELLLAIPEHKVPLPGGRRESQCDVFALVPTPSQVVACAIEGKVDEPFGPTLAEWMASPSEWKRERLAYIQGILSLKGELDGGVRYQLLHRTASAVVEAQRFLTGAAAMIVHSFSPERRWFEDYARFVQLFGPAPAPESTTVEIPCGRRLLLGWAAGDQAYRLR